MTRYWFIASQQQQSSKLALFTFMLAFVVILLGAFTRLTDAGLSCPDWPNCYGYLTAPHTPTQLQGAALKYPDASINIKKAWTEMTHRYFAATEAVLIVVFSFLILFHRKARTFRSTIMGLALLSLLCMQIMLGAFTVTEKLKPIIVLSHLLTGISILSVLWWAYLDSYLSNETFLKKNNGAITPWLWLAFFIVVGQITLGGWVSTHYAGLACVDFPYCNGQLLPNMQWGNLNTDLISIHMLHRIGAMITALYLGGLSLFMLAQASSRVMGLLLITLIGIQVSLGILNIVWLRPVWIALMHQSVAILLLLTVITCLVKVSVMRNTRYGSWLA